MAGCQKQSLNQRPLPICSAGSTGILNRSKLSAGHSPTTATTAATITPKKELSPKAFGTKGGKESVREIK